MLVEDFGLSADHGLVRLADIVHAADVSEDIDSSPEGRGLSAIAHGFALLHGTANQRKIELETPMYHALYAWCQHQDNSQADGERRPRGFARPGMRGHICAAPRYRTPEHPNAR